VNEDCLKLTTYLGERDRSDGRFLADELVDLYARQEVRTSILLRGAEGFGLKHRLRSDRLLTLSEDLPIVSVAVDARERIERLCHPTGRDPGEDQGRPARGTSTVVVRSTASRAAARASS
jgi:PII-like signaling protein